MLAETIITMVAMLLNEDIEVNPNVTDYREEV